MKLNFKQAERLVELYKEKLLGKKLVNDGSNLTIDDITIVPVALEDYDNYLNCYHRERNYKICILPYINKEVKIRLISFFGNDMGYYDFEIYCKENNIDIEKSYKELEIK